MAESDHRRDRSITLAVATALGGMLALAPGVSAQASPSPEAASSPSAVASPVSSGGDLTAAREYCVSVGGSVQQRQAMWGTNNDPSAWVDLGRSIELCRFQADDEAQSRIYVDLLTLWSVEPSLAAGAYVAKVPMDTEGVTGNPATAYCADLQASAQFGFGASSGGWVAEDDPDDPVVAMCVFPDGSMIDEWGLAYMSDGTVRGADLSTLFRSASHPYPPLFG
jgi:putative hemolysin